MIGFTEKLYNAQDYSHKLKVELFKIKVLHKGVQKLSTN